MKSTLRQVALLLLLVVASPASAAQLAEKEVLPNGMVLLHAERKSIPMVTVVLAIKGGSIAEHPEKAGLAYLTATLLTEGTQKRSSRDISAAIEFVGGSLTASAGADYATVSLSVLRKDIALGFDLLSDIVMRPAFSEAEFRRTQSITKSWLIQQNEDPGTVASIAFLQSVYGGHPYGRQVQGTIESLDAISRQDILRFHETYYAPNNAIMSVVGDIGREELKALLDSYFSGWQKKDVPAVSLPAVGKRKGPEAIKINKDLTQANIILGHLGISREDPDYYAVLVMNYILGGGGFASRLVDNIRDNRGLAYDVHSSFSANKYGGTFQAGLQTKNASANLVIAEILREMERIRTEQVTDKELGDAKSYLTGSFPLRIDSNSKIARFNLAVEYYGLGLDYVDRYSSIINSVTKDDILRVASKYLDTKDYVLVVVGDMKEAKLTH